MLYQGVDDGVTNLKGKFSESAQLEPGSHFFAADFGAPFAGELTTAVGAMGAAYDDAVGRATTKPDEDKDFGGKLLATGEVLGPLLLGDYCMLNQITTSSGAQSCLPTEDCCSSNLGGFNNLLAGAALDGFTLTPGVYSWDAPVTLGANSKLYLTGGADDVFILRTTGSIVFGAGAEVILDGVLPQNAFWQSAGYLSVLANAKIYGIFLTKTHAAFGANAALTGRVLAQTAVTLIQNAITQPI